MDDASTIPNARTTLHDVSRACVLGLSPRARAESIGRTLAEIAEIDGMQDIGLSAGDFVLGCAVIWSHYAATCTPGGPLPDDVEGQKRHARAATVREMGEIICEEDSGQVMPTAWRPALGRVLKVWALVGQRFGVDGDPRSMAVRETWTREAAFLTG